MNQRRFLPPWTVEELGSCFVVIDSNGQKLAYIYFEEEAGRRSAAKPLSKDEARRLPPNHPARARHAVLGVRFDLDQKNLCMRRPLWVIHVMGRLLDCGLAWHTVT
ncbi:MAG: hypothetical protein WA728_19515, partial [Xanthobacteraceae bacterium]